MGCWRETDTCSYERIEIVGNDTTLKLKKYKLPQGARLFLLRRTLRNNLRLADLVKKLHVPDPLIPAYVPDNRPNAAFKEYRNLIASLVMCCPNLERLTGFHTFYNHEFDLLTHALSKRTNLREHIWLIGENDEVTARSYKQLPPGLLDEQQMYQFWQYHSRWSKLETLMMCSPGSVGVIEHDLFIQVFNSLPSLKRLCISSFDADDFTDQTLFGLPPLKSLRLEECPGITDSGLSRYAASPFSTGLETLCLVHQNITALLTLSKIFASLPELKRFTVIQSDTIPSLPLELIVFQPLFASKTLRSLHWDIDCGEPLSEDLTNDIYKSGSHSAVTGTASQVLTRLTPNAHLALSILHGGFPNLQKVRAPRDVAPRGALQSVCRPSRNANVLMPADRFSLHLYDPTSKTNSLQTARIRAQHIIDRKLKTKDEFMKVVVTDHSHLENGLYNSGRESSNSSNDSGYSLSTNATDPADLFSAAELPSGSSTCDLGYFAKEVGGLQAGNRGSLCQCSSVSTRHSICQCDESVMAPAFPVPPAASVSPTVPARSPLRPPPVVPLMIHEFSLPSFVGRVATTTARTHSPPPLFDLLPDIPGKDGNGGVVGWGDLLRISEKTKVVGSASSNEGASLKDGCTGSWNKGSSDPRGKGKGLEWWKHVERERRKDGSTVEVEHFF